ncbi:MAG: GNAT family N-acetyltransferase [Actinobacteria bacterium]|nr:GNAT family N-acetyltransferase [Actinomycetota bacterium]
MDLITFDSGEAVRRFQEEDRSGLYHVCLATGDSGASALHLYNEKDMLGEIYVGPYLSFQPDLALTLIQDGVSGYALAALDTRSFEDTLSKQWWPLIQEKYNSCSPENFNEREKNLFEYIQNPPLRPEEVVKDYPSHLHIDLLEKAQGRGIGKAMMQLILDTLREQGSKGVHLGMGAQNARAFTFYTKLGFTLLDKNDDEWTMGLKL